MAAAAEPGGRLGHGLDSNLALFQELEKIQMPAGADGLWFWWGFSC